ncbi:MAG TPA: serine/threonine-protein kinase [Planctomycetota bacterium]|nr:serine/threonine-protein kinase [Planctomycetota bacterium]
MAAPVGVGSVLDGRFRITSLLSEGNVSTVYEAVDRSTGQVVAIKMPVGSSERDPLYLERFRREEAIGGALQHPSVIRVFPVERKSRPYLVMEKVGGAPLSTRLQVGHPLPMGEVLRIGIQIARALEYLHEQQVVHRDLKPSNIMVFPDGSIRVIDLGIAKRGEEPEFGGTLGSQPLGTPDYMPPEQVRGESGDPRSDIYSLGAMLYEMATGVPPFQGDDVFYVLHARVVGDPVPPRTLNPELSPELEEVLLHALERDPARRYRSMTVFRQELEHPDGVAVTGRRDRVRPPGFWGIFWRRIRDFVWAMAAIISFFGVMIAVAWKWGRHR